MKKLNILGTEYTLYEDVSEEDDELLKIRDGYTDWSVKKIVVSGCSDTWEIADKTEYVKTIKRHEIIHAYMYESGLDQNSNWDVSDGYSHPEQTVEWFAIQFPKIYETFNEAEAL